MKYTMNLKKYLLIALIIAETIKLTIIILFQHIAYNYREADKIERGSRKTTNVFINLALQFINKL